MAKGKKTGGRKRGSLNKATIAKREAAARAAAIAADGKAAAEAIAAGRTPLEHLLSVMNDPLADPVRRDECAKAAAPFIHPKLGTVDVRHLPSSTRRLPEQEIEIILVDPQLGPSPPYLLTDQGLRLKEIKTVDGADTEGKSKS